MEELEGWEWGRDGSGAAAFRRTAAVPGASAGQGGSTATSTPLPPRDVDVNGGLPSFNKRRLHHHGQAPLSTGSSASANAPAARTGREDEASGGIDGVGSESASVGSRRHYYYGNTLGELPLAQGSLVDRLETAGFACFDGAAGPGYCEAVRSEIEVLHEIGLLVESKNKLTTARNPDGTSAKGHELPKVGVHELDLVVNGEVRAPHALAMSPCINQFYTVEGPALAARLTEACPSLNLVGVDTIKLQYNAGEGGCKCEQVRESARECGKSVRS